MGVDIMALLDMKRMERLGLKDILEKKYYGRYSYEMAMAAKLRDLTFQYLRGELRGVIEDGPEIKELRANLLDSRTMDYFVRTQSRNKAWARELELTVLAELLGANLAVTKTGGWDVPTILSKDPSEEKPTIELHNEYETHWIAKIEGVQTSTLGDGNCGYNAFALSLASLARRAVEESAVVATARMIKREEDTRLTGCIRAAKIAENQFERAMLKIHKASPEKYESIQRQMHDDYLVGLQLAMSELPDEEGRTRIPMGYLSKPVIDSKYLSAVEHVLKDVSVADDDERYASSFRP